MRLQIRHDTRQTLCALVLECKEIARLLQKDLRLAQSEIALRDVLNAEKSTSSVAGIYGGDREKMNE